MLLEERCDPERKYDNFYFQQQLVGEKVFCTTHWVVKNMQEFYLIRGCNQKFPDWPPGSRTANGELSATRCSCIAIL